MRYAFTILVLISIFSQSMLNTTIGVYYHLNKRFIAEKLCINKDTPTLNCNGHCYLSQQIKTAEEREKKAAHSFIKEQEVFNCTCQQTSDLHYRPAFVPTGLQARYSVTYIYSPFFEINHPPS